MTHLAARIFFTLLFALGIALLGYSYAKYDTKLERFAKVAIDILPWLILAMAIVTIWTETFGGV